jgi:MarR family transcriptional regulator, transcriptional regulator for hemolysin
MPAPAVAPIGLHLARTAKAVSRAFDDALAAAGGSLPSWLILISLKTHSLGNQRELADAIGIRGATLTHHLNGMEADGLVVRRRDPDNHRIQRVEPTEAGDAAFHRMRTTAMAFDQRLRSGLSSNDITALTNLLDRLHANVVDESSTRADQ